MDKGLNKHISKEEIYDKLLNIISHQENAYQSHIGILLHPHVPIIKKTQINKYYHTSKDRKTFIHSW